MKFVDYDGTIIELPQEEGEELGLEEFKTTEGKIGKMTVETKQMEIKN